jgi:hypothetical protein
MAERAQVTSVEALESFRARLIIYLSKARPTLEEMCDEVSRTKDWLQSDRRSHWQNELRRTSRELDQARQELFSARVANLHGPTSAQQLAVTRAQRVHRQAEDKLRLLRKWCRDFENLTDPLTKQLDQLHTFLTSDMPRAVAYLAQVTSTLEAYAKIAPSDAFASPAQPSHPNETNEQVEVQRAPVSEPPATDKPGGPTEKRS